MLEHKRHLKDNQNMRKNYEKFHDNDRPGEQMLNTDYFSVTKIKRACWKYWFYCHNTPPKSHLWSLYPKCLFNLWPWFQWGMFKAKQMPWKALRNQKYFNKTTLKIQRSFLPSNIKIQHPSLPPFFFLTASLSLLCYWAETSKSTIRPLSVRGGERFSGW